MKKSGNAPIFHAKSSEEQMKQKEKNGHHVRTCPIFHQNQVRNKKIGHHVRTCPIFRAKASD